MKAIRELLIILLIACVVLPASGQPGISSPYERLKKRYGDVRPWGHGYIIRANETYAFADSLGRLALPFEYRQMAPVLNDRMVLYNYSYELADADGQTVYRSWQPLRLADSARRRFVTYDGNVRVLVSDSGRQLTYGFDTTVPELTMMPISVYQNGRWGDGVISRDGDMLLPAEYKVTSVGTRLYAGLRNDTLVMWEKDKGLLFKAASFHGVRILHNDMITVQKWGAWGLIGRNGRMLTPFRYRRIDDLQCPNPSERRDASASVIETIPGYAIVDQQPRGLINAKGREVLPPEYDDITMNPNGWLILRKALSDYSSLVDAQLKPVLETRAFGAGFVNNRYVQIGIEDQERGEHPRFYDMQARRFVNRAPETTKKKQSPAAANYTRTYPPIPGNRKDSFYINRALSVLRRSGERWGITSITGDTILPFIYDTAGQCAYGFYYVGRGGRYAALSMPEGSLLTPLMPFDLSDIPSERLRDSLVRTKNRALYSTKGGKLRRIVRDEGVDDGNFGELRGGIYVRRQRGRNIRPGIYNRRFKRISSYKPYDNGQHDATGTGLIAIVDSSRKNIAVIDSNGRIRIPFQPRPHELVLRNYSALLIRDTGKTDALYTFSEKGDSCFYVCVPGDKKRRWIYGDGAYSSYGDHVGVENNERITFAGGRNGFITGGKGRVVFLGSPEAAQGADSYAGHYTIAGTGKGWTAFDEEGRSVLPQYYDSVVFADEAFILLKNGKMGMYDIRTRRRYPIIYDSIGSPRSLANHFLVVKSGDSSFFIDEAGKPIPPAWNVPFYSYRSIQSYDGIYGTPAEHDGREYRLYATPGDSLIAVPGEDLPEYATVVRSFMDGTAIMKKREKTGVYRYVEKAWIIPPRYNQIRENSGIFVALTDTETYMYRTDGRLLFKIKGVFREPQPVYLKTQWYMGGWYPAVPVVNSRGKIIVPDTFDHAVLMEQIAPDFYKARTKAGKYSIFDTNGRQVLPAVFDEFSDSWMYNGYLFAWQGDKRCLISPEMKQLTPAVYEEIFPARLRSYVTDSADLQYHFIAMRGANDSFGVLDAAGRERIPCVYDSIRQVHHGKIAVAKKGGKWGLINLQNKAVTRFEYDFIGIFYQGGARFMRGEVTGVLQEDGLEEIIRK